WLLNHLLGWSLTANGLEVMRVLLLIFNALPLIVYLVLLRRLLERMAANTWAQFYVLLAASFGTFVTTFATTLNNHVPAAYSVLFALYPLLSLYDGSQATDRSADSKGMGSRLALSGFFVGFAVAMEPTAALLAVLLF